jgi:hypothetical protein
MYYTNIEIHICFMLYWKNIDILHIYLYNINVYLGLCLNCVRFEFNNIYILSIMY